MFSYSVYVMFTRLRCVNLKHVNMNITTLSKHRFEYIYLEVSMRICNCFEIIHIFFRSCVHVFRYFKCYPNWTIKRRNYINMRVVNYKCNALFSDLINKSSSRIVWYWTSDWKLEWSLKLKNKRVKRRNQFN